MLLSVFLTLEMYALMPSASLMQGSPKSWASWSGMSWSLSRAFSKLRHFSSSVTPWLRTYKTNTQQNIGGRYKLHCLKGLQVGFLLPCRKNIDRNCAQCLQSCWSSAGFLGPQTPNYARWKIIYTVNEWKYLKPFLITIIHHVFALIYVDNCYRAVCNSCAALKFPALTLDDMKLDRKHERPWLACC